MNPLKLSDIQNILEYEKIRPEFRARIIALKKHRRMSVGDAVTFVFENRDTVRFQIQEMARIERMVRDADIIGELEAYNPLIPGDSELSATLLVDITEQERIKPTLDSLVGMHRHLFLEIAGERIPASFDEGQFSDERISAVQYIRFRLPPSARAAFADVSQSAQLVITLPTCALSAVIPPDVRASLISDWM
jgi:hypothetical protein